jgi:hypothetical protein
MSDLHIKIKMADGTRSQGVKAAGDSLPSELLDAAIKQWALDPDTKYQIANESQGNTVLQFNQSLASQGVQDGNELVIQGQGIGG